jgi:hypothetical protein
VLLTVATAGFEETQRYVNAGVPVAFDARLVVLPWHKALFPVMAPATGRAFTVTVRTGDVAWQLVELPSVTVYVILVVPDDTGVTTPRFETVATAVLVEFQVYVKAGVPVAFADRESVLPMQSEFPPVIAPATGNALTVTVKAGDVT